jgi:hypothetical protein
MTTEKLFAALDWPRPDHVWDPPGAGARTLARVVRDKIGRPLQRIARNTTVRAGILTDDPTATGTPPVVALVVEFSTPVTQAVVLAAHRLAWNFCRSPLLITLEPHQLRAWTCWERPSTEPNDESIAPITALEISSRGPVLRAAAHALHIAYLATGAYFEAHEDRFPLDQRADQLLLSNLEHIRELLRQRGLSADIVHDLLARLIFIQFLSQRKDRQGRPALDTSVIASLHEENILSGKAATLDQILRSKRDTYNLFHWLNRRFNGDLFPGKGDTPQSREQEWRIEMEAVTSDHLTDLADFVSGTLTFDNGQYSFWPIYSFDAIPLEFISSIYEQFVSKDSSSIGAHYTPGWLVDSILDRVLPWDGTELNVAVLDPSCGSGIFLVKAFQRLVARWRGVHAQENDSRDPPVELLINLLESRLFGVDVNPHAVRVASFSLYLAMCDELDPRTLWHDVTFPRLRDRTLLARDYFDLDLSSGGTRGFDLVIGNAPWGRDSMTPAAEEWAAQNGWPIVNKQIGTLFLAKSLSEVHKSGSVALLQPASSLLHNRSATASAFRRKLLKVANLNEVMDLSALRFKVFSQSSSPVSLAIATPNEPTHAFSYSRPRRLVEFGAFEHLQIEPSDSHEVTASEFAEKPWILSALAWGNGRNLGLLRRIQEQVEQGIFLTLRDLKELPDWVGREGYKRGKATRTLKKPELAAGNHVIIEASNLVKDCIIGDLAINKDPYFHSKDVKDNSVFSGPLLLLAKSWSAELGFRAAIYQGHAIFPASSIYGFHFPRMDARVAKAACDVVNSVFAEWFLTLTSGRATTYRPEILADDLLGLPIGLRSELINANDKETRTQPRTESEIRSLLGLREVDWAVIEDFVDFGLRGFRQPSKARSSEAPSSADLELYCRYFLQALSASVGSQGAATIFEPPASAELGLRIVALHLEPLDWSTDVIVVRLEEEGHLLGLLHRLDLASRAHGTKSMRHLAWRRVARVLDVFESGISGQDVPTAFLVKPNEAGFWTRLAALNDADSVMTDVVTWHLAKKLDDGEDSSGEVRI